MVKDGKRFIILKLRPSHYAIHHQPAWTVFQAPSVLPPSTTHCHTKLGGFCLTRSQLKVRSFTNTQKQVDWLQAKPLCYSPLASADGFLGTKCCYISNIVSPLSTTHHHTKLGGFCLVWSIPVYKPFVIFPYNTLVNILKEIINHMGSE